MPTKSKEGQDRETVKRKEQRSKKSARKLQLNQASKRYRDKKANRNSGNNSPNTMTQTPPPAALQDRQDELLRLNATNELSLVDNLIKAVKELRSADHGRVMDLTQTQSQVYEAESAVRQQETVARTELLQAQTEQVKLANNTARKARAKELDSTAAFCRHGCR
jgi:hypothetical protein